MFLFLRIGKEANLLSDWKYEVKITAIGNITAGIDCHAVSGGQEHTCRDPGTGGASQRRAEMLEAQKHRF